MFKNFKRCVSAAVATSVMLTSVLSTSVIGKTLSITDKGVSSEYEGEISGSPVIVTATADKENPKPGQEVVVTFSIKNNIADGFGGYAFTVEYDENVLEATGKEVTLSGDVVKTKKTDEIAIDPTFFQTNDSYTDMIKAGNDVAVGDGILFAKSFKVKDTAESGSTSVILKNKGKVFITDGNGKKVQAYSVSADFNVKGSVPPAEQTIIKIDNKGTATDATLSDIGETDLVVNATASKEKVKNGETFVVTFFIKNNIADGFGGYAFTIDYDNTMFEPTGNPVTLNEADVVKTKKTNEIAIDPTFFQTNDSYTDMIKAGNDVAIGDGILFAKEFKAIGNEVSGNIVLKNKGKVFITDGNGKKVTAFSKGAVITITEPDDEEESSSSSEEPTETSSEDATETSSEDATETSSEDATETSSEDATENTTSKPTEDATESTTESSRRPSGGGGGSPKKHTTTTTTTKPTTDNKTEPDDKNETNKPSNKPTTTPTTTSKALSFVTKTGVTVNIPKTDSSKTKEFADVKALTPWANSYIQKLTAAGIINGVSDTAFNPKGDTKRGDFMVMIAKLLGLEGTPTSNFSDVPKDKYYYNAIGLTKQIGIAAGVGGNNFDPEATITREQVMAITARVLDLVGTLESADLSVLDKFSDKNNISNYAKGNIASLVAMGIVRGDTEGKINPTNNITRAETAVIMSGVYDIVFDKAEAEVKKAETEADINKAEQEDATGEESSESTTEGETSSEVDDKEISKAVDDYKEVLEYVAAFSDYALDSADDQGRTLNEKFIDEYKDEYTQVYYDMEKYFEKYEDAKEIDLKQFAKDTTDFYNTIKDFGDKLDLAVTSNDAKSAIKDAKKDIEDSVKAVEKALAKK